MHTYSMKQVKTKRQKKCGEFYTPEQLIREMLDSLPQDTWTDKSKTFLDNSAGQGAFISVALDKLVSGHGDKRHALDNQLHAVEIMPDSVMTLQERVGWLVRNELNELVPNPELDQAKLQDRLVLTCVARQERATDEDVLASQTLRLCRRVDLRLFVRVT
jgi:hypothetical protein